MSDCTDKKEERITTLESEVEHLVDLIKALVRVRHNGVGGRDFPAFIDPDGWLKEYENEVLEIAKRKSDKGVQVVEDFTNEVLDSLSGECAVCAPDHTCGGFGKCDCADTLARYNFHSEFIGKNAAKIRRLEEQVEKLQLHERDQLHCDEQSYEECNKRIDNVHEDLNSRIAELEQRLSQKGVPDGMKFTRGGTARGTFTDAAEKVNWLLAQFRKEEE